MTFKIRKKLSPTTLKMLEASKVNGQLEIVALKCRKLQKDLGYQLPLRSRNLFK